MNPYSKHYTGCAQPLNHLIAMSSVPLILVFSKEDKDGDFQVENQLCKQKMFHILQSAISQPSDWMVNKLEPLYGHSWLLKSLKCISVPFKKSCPIWHNLFQITYTGNTPWGASQGVSGQFCMDWPSHSDFIIDFLSQYPLIKFWWIINLYGKKILQENMHD